MTFRAHIDYVVKTLNQLSGLVCKVRHFYPPKGLILFYNSYAESVIRYGLLAYGSAVKTNLEKNEKAQRRIWRAILFQENNWESQTSHYFRTVCIRSFQFVCKKI